MPASGKRGGSGRKIRKNPQKQKQAIYNNALEVQKPLIKKGKSKKMPGREEKKKWNGS